MSKVKSDSLPSHALLCKYQKQGSHTDCYSTESPKRVSFEQFVLAFYSTRLFKLERFILKWLVSRPSTDRDLERMVSGAQDKFAAWSVEARAEEQILLSDFQARTRSWLMIASDEAREGRTTLYFGSAVVHVTNKRTGEQQMGLAFKTLLGFHKLYSVALLWSAARKLSRKE